MTWCLRTYDNIFHNEIIQIKIVWKINVCLITKTTDGNGPGGVLLQQRGITEQRKVSDPDPDQ